MMHHEAGVRTVAVGGQPRNGRMQAPSGTRGAAYYTSDLLDAAMNYTISLNLTAGTYLPDVVNDVYVSRLGLNLRDQVRENETIPVQFLYEPADCRIFYTMETVYNYTKLWKYAADAIWTQPDLCVPGSGGPARSNRTNPSPGSANINAEISYGTSGIHALTGGTQDYNALPSGIISDSTGPPIRTKIQINTPARFDDTVNPQFQPKGKTIKHPCAGNDSPVCGGAVGPEPPAAPKPPAAPYNPLNSVPSGPGGTQDSGPRRRERYLAQGSLGDLVMAGMN